MTEELFHDSAMEWRLLNKLLDPQYKDFINRLSPILFTGVRSETFRAIQLSFIDYGSVTFEALHEKMCGKVPGELTAANGGDIQALIAQAVRLAKKRQIHKTKQELEKLEKEYDPSDDSIRSALDIQPVMAEQDSSIAVGVAQFLGNLHAKANGAYTFAKTGFKFADRHMGGEWKAKELIIIMGGVGAGKTTLVGNSMKKMAQGYINEKTGERVITPSLFFSLEMSKEELVTRWIADELNIDTQDIAAGDVKDYLTVIEEKNVELQQLPMYVIDDGYITLAQMVYEIRKHVHKKHVRVVFIDYLQLMNHHPTGNDNNDLGEVAQVLKGIAKSENICIVLLSQINRGKEGIDALRDSGEVGAAAGVVMQLIPDEEQSTGVVKTIHVAWWKNRYGPAGRKTPLLLNGPYQRFQEG